MERIRTSHPQLGSVCGTRFLGFGDGFRAVRVGMGEIAVPVPVFEQSAERLRQSGFDAGVLHAQLTDGIDRFKLRPVGRDPFCVRLGQVEFPGAGMLPRSWVEQFNQKAGVSIHSHDSSSISLSVSTAGQSV